MSSEIYNAWKMIPWNFRERTNSDSSCYHPCLHHYFTVPEKKVKLWAIWSGQHSYIHHDLWWAFSTFWTQDLMVQGNGHPNSELEISTHPNDSPVMSPGNYGILDKSPYFMGHSFFFLAVHAACGILVPWPGIKPVLPKVKVWSLNQWATKEVYGSLFLQPWNEDP